MMKAPGVTDGDRMNAPSIHDWLGTRQYYLFDSTALEAVRLAVSTSISCVIEGDSGTGKTALALLLAERCAADRVVRIDALQDAGKGISLLRELAESSKQRTVVVCDNVEQIATSLQLALHELLNRHGGVSLQAPFRVLLLSRNIEEELRRHTVVPELRYAVAHKIGLPRLAGSPHVLRLSELIWGDLKQRLSMPAGELPAEMRHGISSSQWPGNIRQLRAYLENCLVMGDLAGPKSAAAPGVPAAPPASPRSPTAGESTADPGRGRFKAMVAEETGRVERRLLFEALTRCDWNVTQTARYLEISRKSLQTKMLQYGLRGEEAD